MKIIPLESPIFDSIELSRVASLNHSMLYNSTEWETFEIPILTANTNDKTLC